VGSVFYLERGQYADKKPYFCYLPPQALNGKPTTNQVQSPVKIPVRSMRGRHNELSLDTQGFEIAHQELSPEYTYDNLLSDSELMVGYDIKMEEFLQNRLKAEKVVVFDQEIRRRNPQFPEGTGEKSNLEQPVRGVHVDSSPASAIERAVYICQQQGCENLLEGRFQIVNAWRPLLPEGTALLDWPLALCDYRSVDVEGDIVPSDTVFLDKVTETLQVHFSPEHQWWFLPGQTRSEVLLFKIFEKDVNKALVCPHAAFQPEDGTHGKHQYRESVEVRAMVFYGNKEDTMVDK